MKNTLLIALVWLCGSLFATEPTLVYLVRHAEKVDQSKDPDLSARGFERAEELAVFFEKVPIHALYASQYQRTQKTLTPIAVAKQLQPFIIDAGSPEDLVNRVKQKTGRTILIAGHSNTLPDLIKRLGGPELTIDDAEYRNIFLLILSEGKTTLQQLQSVR